MGHWANHWDAVVVGAGLGGLTTAAYLATNGLRILVLEQGKVAGGCSQVFRRRGRYEFDVGVHYVGECQPGGTMWSVLRGLGLEESVEFAELDPDGYSTLVFPDLTFRVLRGWDAYQVRLLETFPGEERGIRRCVSVLRRVAEEVDGDFPVGARQVAAFIRRAPLTAAIGSVPMAKLYRRCGLSEPVRAVLSGESGAYAASSTTPKSSPSKATPTGSRTATSDGSPPAPQPKTEDQQSCRGVNFQPPPGGQFSTVVDRVRRVAIVLALGGHLPVRPLPR